MFGVIDESGVLEEDEVFLNLPGRTGVLTRDVIVGRSVALEVPHGLCTHDLMKFKESILPTERLAHNTRDLRVTDATIMIRPTQISSS